MFLLIMIFIVFSNLINASWWNIKSNSKNVSVDSKIRLTCQLTCHRHGQIRVVDKHQTIQDEPYQITGIWVQTGPQYMDGVYVISEVDMTHIEDQCKRQKSMLIASDRFLIQWSTKDQDLTCQFEPMAYIPRFGDRKITNYPIDGIHRIQQRQTFKYQKLYVNLLELKQGNSQMAQLPLLKGIVEIKDEI